VDELGQLSRAELAQRLLQCHRYGGEWQRLRGECMRRADRWDRVAALCLKVVLACLLLVQLLVLWRGSGAGV
jgi:hypothetical protein